MATKKQIPFTVEGIRRFATLDEAIKYYGSKENGTRLRRSVSSLYVQAWEFNVGKVSINLSSFVRDYKLDGQKLKKYIDGIRKFSTEDNRWNVVKRAEKQVEIWYGRSKDLEPRKVTEKQVVAE